MIKGAGQVLLALVGGAFLTSLGLFILAFIVFIIGDFAGLPSFQLAPGGLLIFGFQAAGENTASSFYLGEGAYYLVIAVGVLNAVTVALRLTRR
ncbi:hypothetical protein [Brockia lithotrophica]|uniref:Uncharacterized protein n=1 Tax=Brockia lithotrophica TaxID=933949 RepID=A0A660LB02_9BACL|nr:hypothetical protein [Brockia lithotrophica]RKQ88780.1 hypothetical protein C7438_0422 [Brockia lithotrophica]